ncbi:MULTISPECIES: DUF1217 domain-containing protein [Hoeflea]|uniref:DUF1217 domain-containing protein n=1 Tax=Hoeflea alexandrii TaxID=288436 RepID=A0ABT1CNU8_9HYPH|nr:MULTISPECIES: DUF1217 domain-containing protein [Hoeflea]MCO6407803.1 DUF1217 domain-containing protein [Hoeflea alexandrii]VVT10524.1 conserved hypothetical protein [Hoeflea sp. EC-HK425]
MITSFQSYQFYTKDINETLRRAAADAVTSRELQYYRDNIGSITSIDEFLGDDRIYAYAMKAYGLEEMTYAKAFIRKVLESDLTDTDSFANLLTDTKYRTLAAAYDFGSTVTSEIIQTTSQIDNLIDTYEQSIEDNDGQLKADTAYFTAVSQTFTTVDDLFRDTRARDYVFTTFGIDPSTFDYNTIRSVITSDISDANSYVNSVIAPQVNDWLVLVDDLNTQLADPANTPAQKDKINYLIAQYSKAIAKADNFYNLAAAFNFKADGTLDAGVDAMSAAQLKMVTESYVLSQPRLTTTGALLNKQYYEDTISTVTTIDELLNNSRLSIMLLTAYGIPLTTSRADVKWALEQDTSDLNGEIYTKSEGMIALAKAFNFEADGSITPGLDIQDSDQLFLTMANYIDKYNDADEEADQAAIAKYKLYIGLTKNLDDFLSAEPAAVTIREFALKAFNIAPEEVSTFKLKQIFTSDPYDPESYVNQMKDDRFVQLVKAYNFAADGSIGSPRYAQSENEITRISKAYYTAVTRLDSSESSKAAAEAEAVYYRTQLQSLETVDQLLADVRLKNVLLVAEGLRPVDVSNEMLRAVLTSDLDDPDSFANQQSDIGFQKVAGSFNFDADGFIRSESGRSVQNERGLVETQRLYLTQAIEEEAGQESLGARLALYFERMAPTVTSNFEILADDALAQFVRTAFSISEETASSDIDKQKAMLDRYLDVDDLLDPEKLESLIQRFLALYDLDNGAPDPLLTIMNGSTSINFETVATLAQLRASF